MNMKRIALLVAAVLLGSALYAQNFDLVRSRYKLNGYTHILSEPLPVSGSASDKHPFSLSVEYIAFPDNTYLYALECDFETTQRWSIPLDVKFTATTEDGKMVSFKQINKPSTEKRVHMAKDGKTPIYHNVLRYMLDENEMQKLLSGVKHTDIAYGYEPDSYIATSYQDNQFTAALKQQYDALKEILLPGDELGSHIADYANNPGNLMVVTEALPVKGQAASYQVSMTYMYFKASNSEAFDLNIALPAGKELPLDAPVVFTLGDDSTVELKQQRAGDNVVYLYPTSQQVKQLAWKGIKKIEFGLVQADTFPDDAMSAVIDKLYNSLMAVIAI